MVGASVDSWCHNFSLQKIFGLCGLQGHIMEKSLSTADVWTECEDRARILDSEFVMTVGCHDNVTRVFQFCCLFFGMKYLNI